MASSSSSKLSSHAGAAPEVDLGALAPQHHLLAEGLHPHDGDLSVEPGAEKSGPEPIEIGSSQTKHRISKRKSIRNFIIISISLALIAITVGLVLGLQHTEQPQSTSTPAPASPTASSAPNDSILNSTYLGAVTTNDGKRHVFFQGVDGSLRHTFFNNATNSSQLEADYVRTNSTPRPHTPIAAIEMSVKGLIHVFFITTNNLLAAASYNLYVASDNSVATNPMNGSFSVAPNSSTLSVLKLPLTRDRTRAAAILMYEAPNTNVSTLHGYLSNDSDGSAQWYWQNISESIYLLTDPHNVWLSSPLALTSALDNDYLTESELVFWFYNRNSLSNDTIAPLCSFELPNWEGLFPNASSATYSDTGSLVASLGRGILERDLIMFNAVAVQRYGGNWTSGLIGWVQNGSFFFYFDDVPGPTTPYPFTPVAWINDTSASTTYFYHQYNSTVLVEDVWYGPIEWKSPTYVTIPSST